MKLPDPKHIYLLMWMIWLALLVSVVVTYLVLGNVLGSGVNAGAEPVVEAGSQIWLLGLLPLAVSAAIRWVVLPGVRSIHKALPLFIVGIALAEAAGILGVILFPDRKAGLFVLALLGVLQFIPTFAKRMLDSDGGDPNQGIPRQG